MNITSTGYLSTIRFFGDQNNKKVKFTPSTKLEDGDSASRLSGKFVNPEDKIALGRNPNSETELNEDEKREALYKRIMEQRALEEQASNLVET